MDYRENHNEKSAYLVTIILWSEDFRDMLSSYFISLCGGVRIMQEYKDAGTKTYIVLSKSPARRFIEDALRLFNPDGQPQRIRSMFLTRLDPESMEGLLCPSEWDRVKALLAKMSALPLAPVLDAVLLLPPALLVRPGLPVRQLLALGREPRRRRVRPAVGHQPQVTDAVVGPHAVDVVDDLLVRDLATQVPRHHGPVDKFVRGLVAVVALLVDVRAASHKPFTSHQVSSEVATTTPRPPTMP